MTNRERVLALIRSEPDGVTDSEIRERTGIKPHQQVNQICRKLAQAGLIHRRSGRDGRLSNLPVGSPEENPQPHPHRTRGLDTRPGTRFLQRTHAGDWAVHPFSIRFPVVWPRSWAPVAPTTRRKRRSTNLRFCRPSSDTAAICIRRQATRLASSSGRERTSSSSRVDTALSSLRSQLGGTTRSTAIQCGRTVWSRDVWVATRTRRARLPSSVCSRRQPNMPGHSARPTGPTQSNGSSLSVRSRRRARWSRRRVLKARH